MHCRICGSDRLESLGIESLLFPGQSYAPDVHLYENYVCPGCGVVSGQPEPSDEDLAEHYNSTYRISRDALEIGGAQIDAPIDMTIAGRSLARVKNFHALIEKNVSSLGDLRPGEEDLVVDYGAYQGMFLHGVSQIWPCRCLAYDYSENGIAFAREYLGYKDSVVAQDIYEDRFDQRPRFVTMIHSLEHLREPQRFLRHVSENILVEDGYLYIEVPNLYGTALCEPVHFFTYSKDSLKYLLAKCGFELVDMATSGFPVGAEFTAHNAEQNIICLARNSGEMRAEAPEAGVDTGLIRRDLRAAYARHSAAATRRQIGAAFREAAKSIYYLGVTQILERLSLRLSMRVVKWLGLRK
jgi:hypothetical protein